MHAVGEWARVARRPPPRGGRHERGACSLGMAGSASQAASGRQAPRVLTRRGRGRRRTTCRCGSNHARCCARMMDSMDLSPGDVPVAPNVAARVSSAICGASAARTRCKARGTRLARTSARACRPARAGSQELASVAASCRGPSSCFPAQTCAKRGMRRAYARSRRAGAQGF